MPECKISHDTKPGEDKSGRSAQDILGLLPRYCACVGLAALQWPMCESWVFGEETPGAVNLGTYDILCMDIGSGGLGVSCARDLCRDSNCQSFADLSEVRLCMYWLQELWRSLARTTGRPTSPEIPQTKARPAGNSKYDRTQAASRT